DAVSPTAAMTLPFPDAGVAAESITTVEALAKDNIAVAGVEFFADGQRIGFASVAGSDRLGEFRGTSVWSTVGLLLDSQHQLTARAVDMAGLTGDSRPISVQILPAHCFDGQQNENEEQVDCGGSCR